MDSHRHDVAGSATIWLKATGSASDFTLVVRIVVLTAALGLLATLRWTPRRVRYALAPALALALAAVWIQRTITPPLSAPFQAAEVARGRETFAKAVPPNAVVITSEDIGRPAENIEYYAGVPTLYLTDVERWHVSLADVAEALIAHGFEPHLLISSMETGRTAMLEDLSRRFTTDRTLIPAPRRIDYFVASPIHTGYDAELYRIRRRD